MEMNQKDMDIFQRVVLAGMKLMFSEKTFPMLKSGLTKVDVPLPQRLALETAGLFKMLMEKSGNKIPIQLIAPAGAMMLMEMAKFAADGGIAKPTQKDIAEASGLLLKMLHKMYAGGQQQPPAAPPAEPMPQQPPAAPAQPMPPAGIMQGA